VRGKRQFWIVAIDAYEGNDTSISVTGDHEPGRLYAIIETSPKGASVYDIGYRTRAEAKRACPEAS
jgi:hypothetical protein